MNGSEIFISEITLPPTTTVEITTILDRCGFFGDAYARVCFRVILSSPPITNSFVFPRNSRQTNRRYLLAEYLGTSASVLVAMRCSTLFGPLCTGARRSLHTVNGGRGDELPLLQTRRRIRVTLIEGPGPAGSATCAAVRRIFDAAGVPVQWDRRALHAHRDSQRAVRHAVNADVVQSAVQTGLVFCGPISNSARFSDALALHKALGAFVGVRLFASVPGHQPFGRVRMVNVRDNVSGEYSEIEHTVAPGNEMILAFL